MRFPRAEGAAAVNGCGLASRQDLFSVQGRNSSKAPLRPGWCGARHLVLSAQVNTYGCRHQLLLALSARYQLLSEATRASNRSNGTGTRSKLRASTNSAA
jgi:hypothetical protein